MNVTRLSVVIVLLLIISLLNLVGLVAHHVLETKALQSKVQVVEVTPSPTPLASIIASPSAKLKK